MSSMSWWRRLAKREQMERHLDAELRFHFDGLVADNLRAGMSEPEARRSARLQFGGLEQVKEECREARGLAWLEGIFYDLRFALRSLRRDRGFTITAITILALAIGLNVTVFAVMNTMLFRGVPLAKRNDRLVYMQERYPSGVCCISYPDFEDWRAQAQSFERMAFVGEKSVSLSDGNGERPVYTPIFTMSANAFGLLGVQPLLGRDFVPADEEPGAPPVAILNYRFWENRFAKRPDIVGHIVRIDKAPATVIRSDAGGFRLSTPMETMDATGTFR
jgi:putative ABC transport system permease protein